MYQIRCDEFILHDPRDSELVVLDPVCNLEVNTVGEASFTILTNHPYYDKLRKLRSIFEIWQDNDIIFRGRMTNDSRDFYNQTNVDIEGILAVTNDTLIAPFSFPEDFPDAGASGNIVEYFLRWIIDQHNAQGATWQQLKVGNVTVSDPNNYITRASENYLSTWDVLKTKLFESGLGGYLCVRYETDGTYIDYLSEFELDNTQKITFGENLLDLVNETDASETYTAIMPIGAEIETDDGDKYTVMLDTLPDGDLTDDLVKSGNYIYSKSAREEFGWICVPVDNAKWDDVTDAANLQTKAMQYLQGNALLMSSTITIKAVDLAFTDAQMQSFRLYRNVVVYSPAHGANGARYALTRLHIDITKPENTEITIGDTIRTLTNINARQETTAIQRVEEVAEMTTGMQSTIVSSVQQQMIEQTTSMTATCSEMILAAAEQYVLTGDFEEFRQSTTAQLEIMASEIAMHFTTTTEAITDVDGDMQAKFSEIYKRITFSGNGITIGDNTSGITLEIDNDMIVFKKNGMQFGWWDGVDFHTGNIVVDVNERAQFGNFAWVPRSDGSLMFLKVGG